MLNVSYHEIWKWSFVEVFCTKETSSRIYENSRAFEYPMSNRKPQNLEVLLNVQCRTRNPRGQAWSMEHGTKSGRQGRWISNIEHGTAEIRSIVECPVSNAEPQRASVEHGAKRRRKAPHTTCALLFTFHFSRLTIYLEHWTFAFPAIRSLLLADRCGSDHSRRLNNIAICQIPHPSACRPLLTVTQPLSVAKASFTVC